MNATYADIAKELGVEPPRKVRPLRDLVLVQRLEGHGIERVTPGGIVIPAACEAKAKTKNDYFRARVIAKGPKAPPELEVGEDVLVHTWAGGDGTGLYTGALTSVGNGRMLITPDDIVCAFPRGTLVEGVNARGLDASDRSPAPAPGRKGTSELA